jgi:hypothetical protein
MTVHFIHTYSESHKSEFVYKYKIMFATNFIINFAKNL